MSEPVRQQLPEFEALGLMIPLLDALSVNQRRRVMHFINDWNTCVEIDDGILKHGTIKDMERKEELRVL